MDTAASPPSHHDFSTVNASSSRRPTIPPKPKSTGSLKLHDSDAVEGKPGVATSTVGTQVNLLLRRRPPESGTHDGVLKLDPDGKRSEAPKESGEELKSPGLCATKPVIPPKPSAKILTPRKSTSIQKSPTVGEENQKSSVPPPPSQTLVPVEGPVSKAQDIVNPIDKSIEIQKPSLEKSATSPGESSTLPKSNSLNRHSTPHPLPIQYCGIPDPIQRLQAQRKSTSLGRRTIFSPFTNSTNSASPSKLSGFSHLDLTSSSQLVSLFLSHDKPGLSADRTAPPPPPPPRRRNSQKVHCIGLENSTGISLSQRHQSAPVSPSACTTPIYAVVDKEKKWEARRLKLENERLNSTTCSPSDLTETDKMASDVVLQSTPPRLPLEIRDNSLPGHRFSEPITPTAVSWLGKFMSQDKPSLDLDFELGGDVFSEPPTPGENKSFLFTRTNPHSFPEGSDPPELEDHTDGDTTECDSDDGNQDKTDGQLAKDDPHSDCGIENKEIEKIASAVLSQNSKNSSPQLESVLKDEPTAISVKRLIKDEPDREDSEVRKPGRLESTSVSDRLRLAGVTETESSTEDPKEAGTSDADLIHEIIRSQEQFKPQFKKMDLGDSTPTGQVDSKGKDRRILSNDNWQSVLPPLISRGSFRRRSWTCSEHASSLTESSPTSSSSSSLLERTISISGSMGSHTQWADEGELSTGALGDTENSDACHGGSVEDFSPSSSIRSGSLPSKSKRIVSSIFASFGKGVIKPGSYAGNRKLVDTRSTSGHKRKEKSKSHFFFDAIQSPHNGKKSNSEVYLTRGKAIRLTGTKETFAKMRIEGLGSLEDSPPRSMSAVSDTKSYNSGVGVLQSSTSTAVEADGAVGRDSPKPPVDPHAHIIAELNGRKAQQAFFAAREMLTTERDFVKDINLLAVAFPEFIKETEKRLGHSIISKDNLELILGGLPNLKTINESLLHDLEQRIPAWLTTPKVSDIFISTAPFLKHYGPYIRDHNKILSTFTLICHNTSEFANAVAEFEMSRCRNLKLSFFFIKPVQRMTQYILSWTKYLKNLDPSGEDYQGTLKAMQIVKEVACHAEDKIRIQESTEKLMQLQKRLPQNVSILQSNRHLILEGELRKVCRKELQPRYFALMSDCLMCMTYAGSPGTGSKELKISYDLPLKNMRVAIAANEDYQNEFSVISTSRSFNLVAKSRKERHDWMEALKDTIMKLSPTPVEPEAEPKVTQIGKVAPVWVADKRVTMCQCCTAVFTTTFRRHHCRACGKVTCSDCSGNKAPLQYRNFEAVRVCDDCFTHLLEEFDSQNLHNSEPSVEAIRNRFKKATPSISKKGAKHKKSIPARLDVHGNAAGSSMNGYLKWREGKNGWKKNWFTLLGRVLYVYAASEDVKALRGIPILGYQVQSSCEDPEQIKEGDSSFRLIHSGQDPFIFEADTSASAKKWISAMKEATVMKSDEV